jgi:metal-responsive CopG/Arc/MetJ family transcriptional regulator
MWCMQRTNIYLEDRQTAALDRLAGEEGISRAELIRRILDRALRGPDDLAADLAQMDFAFGGSVEIDVPSRAREARERLLDALMDVAE